MKQAKIYREIEGFSKKRFDNTRIFVVTIKFKSGC